MLFADNCLYLKEQHILASLFNSLTNFCIEFVSQPLQIVTNTA